MKPRPTSRTDGTWRLWRAGEVDVLVRPSLFLMGAALVIVFGQRFGDRTDANPFVLALTFVVGLYVSVLVHELAHVWAAKSFGMNVVSVTLHLLGGETAIEGESRRPLHELWIAIVGPLASVLIGVACLAVDDLFGGTTAAFLTTIGWVNLLVAAFNMIPGLPLDGGRVLRALIWWVTGRELLGIRVAGWIGRTTAVVVVVFVALRPRTDTFVFDLAIAGLVAWFLWVGASQALRQASSRSRIDQLVARDLADPVAIVPAGAVTLDANLAGEQLLRSMAAHPSPSYALTESDGTVVGLLTVAAVDAAYRGAR